jgi:hypothetical protein
MSNPVPALGADDLTDDVVYYEFYKEGKRSRNILRTTAIQSGIMYRERHAYEKMGCDFCITSGGKMYVGWKLPTHDAAMASTIKDKHVSYLFIS